MSGLCERCHENASATNDVWCADCILEVELMMAEAEEKPVMKDLDHLHFRPLGRNGHYTLEDLERRIAEYEDEYGLPSDALLEMHVNGRAPLDLHHFDRHLWLSFYRESLEIQEGA